MNGPSAHRQRWATWPKVSINAGSRGGGSALIPWAAMAFHPEDTEALESPLLLPVAHQIEAGPRGLYGPYDGHYPLVLIHAAHCITGWRQSSAG